METRVTTAEAAKIYRENNNRVVDDSIDGFVVLKDVNKVYDNRVQAVFDFNLSVSQNEFIVLVGPSGCGKSTTLRMIAGLEEITNGYLYIDKIMSNYLEPKDRDIAMVFQSYALYPNMTVYDNIGFGLKARHCPPEIIKQRVFEAAEILDLGAYLDRKPKELSGGQMQRVALGRAIVRNAKLFLMDEPLSNLDAKLRVQMRSEIVKLHNNIHATTIYVTHDQTEAMTMADRIVIMNQGVVQQIGTPMEIYNDPKNVFVATFIGNPPMNVFMTSLAGNKICCGNTDVPLPDGVEARYVEYIEQRKQFFAELLAKADLSAEKTLITTIDAYIKGVKKLTGADRDIKLDWILDEAQRIATQKGFIKFDDERRAQLRLDLTNGDFKSLKTDLIRLRTDLVNTDLAIAGILKKYDSAGVMKVKTELPTTGKKEKAKKEEKVSLEHKNIELINMYIEKYSDPSAKENVYVGIRPEDIHLAAEFDGNASAKFVATASFVEMLGSEMNIYIDMFDKRIIIKQGLKHVVKTGDAVELCFDMDKLRLFDAISCERVL